MKNSKNHFSFIMQMSTPNDLYLYLQFKHKYKKKNHLYILILSLFGQ